MRRPLGGAVIIGLLVSALSLGACSETPLTEEDLTLSAIEGRWLCDVQRFTFEDLGDIDAALDERLAENGFTRETYRSFKDRLADDPRIRDEVQTVFESYCQ